MIFHSSKSQISILSCKIEQTQGQCVTFNTVWNTKPFE